jgi:UDP-N-acetylmuramoyl-tripeptide--D-alanyl-D-alanine ligase
MDILAALPGSSLIGVLPQLSTITHDSREVRPGDAFIAVPGVSADGHDFIGRAIGAGASLAVVQADREQKWAPFRGRIPLIVVEDSR